jgi:hypothetical protein
MELVNIGTRELANEADKGKAGSFRGSFQKQNITNGGCKGPKVLDRSLNISTVLYKFTLKSSPYWACLMFRG